MRAEAGQGGSPCREECPAAASSCLHDALEQLSCASQVPPMLRLAKLQMLHHKQVNQPSEPAAAAAAAHEQQQPTSTAAAVAGDDMMAIDELQQAAAALQQERTGLLQRLHLEQQPAAQLQPHAQLFAALQTSKQHQGGSGRAYTPEQRQALEALMEHYASGAMSGAQQQQQQVSQGSAGSSGIRESTAGTAAAAAAAADAFAGSVQLAPPAAVPAVACSDARPPPRLQRQRSSSSAGSRGAAAPAAIRLGTKKDIGQPTSAVAQRKRPAHQIQLLQQRALQLHAEVQSLGDSKQQLQSLQVRLELLLAQREREVGQWLLLKHQQLAGSRGTPTPACSSDSTVFRSPQAEGTQPGAADPGAGAAGGAADPGAHGGGREEQKTSGQQHQQEEQEEEAEPAPCAPQTTLQASHYRRRMLPSVAGGILAPGTVPMFAPLPLETVARAAQVSVKFGAEADLLRAAAADQPAEAAAVEEYLQARAVFLSGVHRRYNLLNPLLAFQLRALNTDTLEPAVIPPAFWARVAQRLAAYVTDAELQQLRTCHRLFKASLRGISKEQDITMQQLTAASRRLQQLTDLSAERDHDGAVGGGGGDSALDAFAAAAAAAGDAVMPQVAGLSAFAASKQGGRDTVMLILQQQRHVEDLLRQFEQLLLREHDQHVLFLWAGSKVPSNRAWHVELILLSRPFFPNLHAVLCNLVEL